jgi:formylglycine-generating enzyme required for sulfatase activity
MKKRLITSGGMVLAAILIAVWASGCPTNPSDTAIYSISGTIITEDPGGLASGAHMQLRQGGSNVGSAISTGTDGTYTIPGVPAGEGYTIEVSLAGYITGTIPSFNVTTANVTGKNLTLVRIVYTVSGTIATDDPGGLASGAHIQLRQGGSNVGSAVSTGADGTYTISGVPAGEGYTIEVSLTGYTTGTIPSFSVTTANVTGKNLILVRITVPVYTVSGTITTNNPGGAASGALVQLQQDGSNVGSTVNAGTNGTYTIPGVPAGEGYTIEVSLAGYTTGTIPSFNVTTANVIGKNLTLTRIVYTVSGTISTNSPGGAASGASVQLKRGGANVDSAVSTGADGTYTIPGVPAGEGYTIEVSLAGYTTGTIPSFNVTTANVTGKNLILAMSRYTVSGTITTNSPGGAASGASVQLKQGGNTVGSAVNTQTNGTYTISNVLPGNGYTIEVSLAGYTTGTIPSFNVTTANVTGENLTLVRITVPVYTVSGTITTNNPGGAASGALVQLQQDGSNVGGAVYTGTNGNYTIPDIPAGSGYTIEVFLAGYTTGTIPSFNITMANVTGKNLTLARIVYTVSGTIITDDPGGPVNNAHVQLKQGGGDVGGAVYTGTNGIYTIADIPAGSGYTIEVSLAGYIMGTIPSFNIMENITGKNLTLTRIVCTISGTIITDDPGGGASGAAVQLKQGGNNIGSVVSTQTNGTYIISNVLAEEEYTIEVSLAGYTTGTIPSFNVTGNVTGKNLTLALIVFNMISVPVPAGGFIFPTGTADGGTATVANAYEIGEAEVTYELWYAVRDWAVSRGYTFYNNPGREGNAGTTGAGPTGAKREPVTMVNWFDAAVWLNALTEWINERDGKNLEPVYYYDSTYTANKVAKNSTPTLNFVKESSSYSYASAYAKPGANGFRLPTSNEWELAARWRNDSTNTVSGYSDPWFTQGDSASGATADYNNASATGAVAWYSSNASKTQAVKGKAANGLGLYDMSGNVFEWCFDWYSLYVGSVGSTRIIRGGSWNRAADGLQVGYVGHSSPVNRSVNSGFRPARTAQ